MALGKGAMSFTEDKWALLQPGQRKLFWEVLQETYENVAFLGWFLLEREKDIWGTWMSTGTLFLFLSSWRENLAFAWLQERDPQPVPFEEVAVSFTLQEWAVLDPGQRQLYWEVMEEKHTMMTSLDDHSKIYSYR
ncbi:zinc finger protein 560-like [Heteronotia binoei]|uniref:zinc finger protein 560-like n=1 Tax=Heteronotia binoei TaxID=13085 RepID=UPI0029307BC9|nr:zinc finger protein 560-like [Heteronotia binoei]